MFTIITPTYKRADQLRRAILSVQAQSFQDWHMVIVNDSPDDTGYVAIEQEIAVDSRITYIKGDVNQGVNYARNLALDHAILYFPQSWIMLLDDDDWFVPECLSTQSKLIGDHLEYKWFVTNRKGSTRISPDHSAHAYAREWLIGRTIGGDATHCISLAGIRDLRFSKKVRQGEEWLYFYQVSLRYAHNRKNFFYHDFDATLSDGYTSAGLNFRPRTREERTKDLLLLQEEGRELGLDRHAGFRFYIFMRMLKLALLGR